jgi:hypothetical protein
MRSKLAMMWVEAVEAYFKTLPQNLREKVKGTTNSALSSPVIFLNKPH